MEKKKGLKIKNQLAMLIGNAIKEIRLGKDMSLSQLSNFSGVQIATLSRMENGIMTGTTEVHIDIARALGVQLDEIYKNIKILPKQDKETNPAEQTK